MTGLGGATVEGGTTGKPGASGEVGGSGEKVGSRPMAVKVGEAHHHPDLQAVTLL